MGPWREDNVGGRYRSVIFRGPADSPADWTVPETGRRPGTLISRGMREAAVNPRDTLLLSLIHI